MDQSGTLLAITRGVISPKAALEIGLSVSEDGLSVSGSYDGPPVETSVRDIAQGLLADRTSADELRRWALVVLATLDDGLDVMDRDAFDHALLNELGAGLNDALTTEIRSSAKNAAARILQTPGT